jgi:hypothetical protein
MAEMGQQYAFGDATRDGSVAPIPAVRGTAMEPPESTPNRPSCPSQRIFACHSYNANQ